jgi:ERCC4-type nuclease
VTTAPQPLTILVDTREQLIPPFPAGVLVERVTMDAGDYTTPGLQGIAVIERKSVSDFAQSITHSRERFDDEVRRLVGYRWRCIVVEGDLSTVYRESRVHPHSVLGSIASFFARADLATLFAVSASGAGRLIAGILRRWEERLQAEKEAESSETTFAP